MKKCKALEVFRIFKETRGSKKVGSTQSELRGIERMRYLACQNYCLKSKIEMNKISGELEL